MTEPRIYVACLASYNAGKLHGVWIDADQDADDINAEIAEMLRASPCPNVEVDCPTCDPRGYPDAAERAAACPMCKGRGKVPSAEEYAIHDHEGFEGIEPDDIESASLHARMLAEHDGAWSAYIGYAGVHHATEEGFEESYEGEYHSAKDFAAEWVAETSGDALKAIGDLAQYIDWEGYAHDLDCNGWHFIDGGIGVYVFSPH